MTSGLTERQRSAQEEVLQVLRTTICYDLMPVSSKIVVLDTELSVKASFRALSENGLNSALLWDYKVSDYVGVVTVTDFVDILRHFYYDSSSPSDKPKFPELERFRVREWRELLAKQRHASLIRSLPDDTLIEAAEKLIGYKIHRLPLVDPAMNNVVLTVITTESILKSLILRLENSPDELFDIPISDLKIGTFDHVVTVLPDTRLIVVLNLLSDRGISAVPVVNADGIAVDIFTKSDVVGLCAFHEVFENLDRPLSSVLLELRCSPDPRPIHSCTRSSTITELLTQIFENNIRRVMCVDSTNRIEGIISLTDILEFFLQS